MLPLIFLLSLLGVSAHLDAAEPIALLFFTPNSNERNVWSPTEEDTALAKTANAKEKQAEVMSARDEALAKRAAAEERLRKATDNYRKTDAFKIYLAEIRLLVSREKELEKTGAESPFGKPHWEMSKRKRGSRSDLRDWREGGSISPNEQPPSGRASTETTSSTDSVPSLIEQPPTGCLPRFTGDVRVLSWIDFTKK